LSDKKSETTYKKPTQNENLVIFIKNAIFYGFLKKFFQ